MSNEKLVDILNDLVDVGLRQSHKNSRELAFDFINIKLRYQMRLSGMSNKQIKFEMDRVKEGIPLRPS